MCVCPKRPVCITAPSEPLRTYEHPILQLGTRGAAPGQRGRRRRRRPEGAATAEPSHQEIINSDCVCRTPDVVSHRTSEWPPLARPFCQLRLFGDGPRSTSTTVPAVALSESAMALKQASFFPLLSVVFALLAFFIGYAIAVAKGDVDPFLPYISDCGNLQPESGIFGELLNLSSFFLMVTVYLVHRNFVVTYEKVEHKYLGKWKIFSICLMLLGIASAVGASMVANFQEGVQLATHDTGAFLFFIGITIYFWGQVLIGFALRPKSVNLCLSIFRCLLCIAITLFLVFHLTCLFANPFIQKDANGKTPAKPTFPNGIEKFPKGSPFYWNHIATTLSEWILALLLETFVLTFVFELAYTSLEAPTVKPHDPLSTDDPDRTFYTNQVAPIEPMLQPVQPLEVPSMRRLPRIDISYGTYSRKGTDDVSYSAYKIGKDEVVFGTYSRTGKEESAPLNGVTNIPYERNHVMSGYNQYHYF